MGSRLVAVALAVVALASASTPDALVSESVWDDWLVESTVGTCEGVRALYDAETCCDNGPMAGEYVTFRRPTSLCAPGWRSFDFGGETKCVKLHPRSVWTKAEATAACASENATLVEPTTAAKSAAVVGLIAHMDTPWSFFWVGATQSSTATGHAEEWTWDSTGEAATYLDWFPGQPTVYSGAADDGPEDCVLYFSKFATVPGLGTRLYDFHCTPSSTVVCAAPIQNATGAGSAWDGCWNGMGFQAAAIESSTPDVCLKILPEKAYSVAAAKVACGESNGWLVYTRSRDANARLNDWVHGLDPTIETIFLNVVQDVDATSPMEGWRLPSGELYPMGEMPWNAPSDPELVEGLADFMRVHVEERSFLSNPVGGGGEWQDITAMTTGAGAICIGAAQTA
jgi:hypothetical protein